MNQKSLSAITNMNENKEKTELVSMNNTSTNSNYYIPYGVSSIYGTVSPIEEETIYSQQKEEKEKMQKSGFDSLQKEIPTTINRTRNVGYFEKISYKQWIEDSGMAIELIENMRMPQRSTELSAGYDFYSAFDFTIPAMGSIVIPTGLRFLFTNPQFFLALYPRSGLGFKHRISLSNTVGIIDADYYYSDNEGHIMVKLFNPNDYDVNIEKGMAYCQGIFQLYGITCDDDIYEKSLRTGGFGSTSK